MSPANPLGEFLRACRSQLTPADVGLGLGPGGRHRRVAGLRREEVSVLSQVSVDYYSRLEQGRERHPSPRTAEALAKALRLDPDTRNRLFLLAGLDPRLCSDDTRGHAHPELLRLLETANPSAAYALSPSFDVLAANAEARALLSPLGGVGGGGGVGGVGGPAGVGGSAGVDAGASGSAGGQLNLIRALFTHPQAKSYYTEWPLAVTASLHALRLNAARLPGDIAIADLVADLSAGVADFATAWRDGSAAVLERAYGTVVHPEAGRVALTYRVRGHPAAPGQRLLVGTPAPGSRSVEALVYLAAMAER
ncbi:helix-turn-helix transcriptional regulator [Streptomyces tauricus]|uniref:helix-turn-helix domain-containing protein n=1 Tax=Streptomyces tauricus TaxID=68274 RepID=UPI0033CDAB23